MRIVAQRGENTYLVLIKEDESKKDNDREAVGSVVDVDGNDITVHNPHLVFAIMSRGYWKEPENIDKSLETTILQKVGSNES